MEDRTLTPAAIRAAQLGLKAVVLEQGDGKYPCNSRYTGGTLHICSRDIMLDEETQRRFEQRYGIAARIDRNLWLTGDRFQPDYAGRPWTLWTANSTLARTRMRASYTPESRLRHFPPKM